MGCGKFKSVHKRRKLVSPPPADVVATIDLKLMSIIRIILFGFSLVLSSIILLVLKVLTFFWHHLQNNNNVSHMPLGMDVSPANALATGHGKNGEMKLEE